MKIKKGQGRDLTLSKATFMNFYVLRLGKIINILFPVTFEMVFCYQNCSSDREKLLKFEAEGREFAKFLRSLRQLKVRTISGN